MRCIVLILIMNLVLVPSALCGVQRKSAHQKKFQKSTSDPSFCQINLKSTKLASCATDDAKAAKDAQKCAAEAASQKAMERLADKAEQAARAAEAALNGKKQLLDELEQSQIEADAVIEEVKKALVHSRNNIETAARDGGNIKRLQEYLNRLVEEAKMNVEKLQEICSTANSDLQDKKCILTETKKRFDELSKCHQKAKKDLEETEEMAKQATAAADEAKQRVETVTNIFKKIKKLKKKNLGSLQNIMSEVRKN